MSSYNTVLSTVAAASRTLPWMHHLHAKGGNPIPSNLQTDDLVYGQHQILPLPLPSSNSKEPSSSSKAKQLNLKQQLQQQPCQGNNPSLPNPSSSNPPPPQLQISTFIAGLYVTTSSIPPANPPIEAFCKKNHPHPRSNKLSRPSKENKDKDKNMVNKRRRIDRTTNVIKERSTNEVTIIDTSTNEWKAAKLLLCRGDVWKVHDNTDLEVSEPMDPTKVKRRASLVSKIRRDMEKEKNSTSPENIHASNGDVIKESDVALKL